LKLSQKPKANIYLLRGPDNDKRKNRGKK